MTDAAQTDTTRRPEEESMRWGALAALFLATAFIFANMYTTQAILPVLSQDFRVSAPTAGLTVSMLVLAVAFGSLLYGPLSDRIGRKPVMVGVSLLVTLPTLLCGLAPNFAALVVLRAMQGFLMPGLTSVAIPYVNEEFAGKRRGLAMGIYVFGQTIGGLFARSGSALLTGLFSWRIALLAFTLPTLIAALAMWRFLPETKSKHVAVMHESTMSMKAGTTAQRMTNREFIGLTLRNMLLHLHNRRLVGAFVIGFASFLASSASSPIFPTISRGRTFACPRPPLVSSTCSGSRASFHR